MTYKLPIDNLKWIDKHELSSIAQQLCAYEGLQSIDVDGDTGFILEVILTISTCIDKKMYTLRCIKAQQGNGRDSFPKNLVEDLRERKKRIIMSTENQMPVPEKEKEETKKKEVGERKRKRAKPVPCKCVETVRRVNAILRDVHEYTSETIVNFPELTGKILELSQKAMHNEIVWPLHLYKKQLTDEESRGVNTTKTKLQKSQLCNAKVHDPEDTFPNLVASSNVCYASDEGSDY